MMKRFIVLALIVLMSVSLFACASAPAEETTADSLAAQSLSIEYADAASVKNQLAYGTLKLADTPNAVTPEQAAALIPLWQAMLSLSGDSTVASEEITAVQDQIVATMTAEQMQAIAAMQLTNADLNAFYAEYGVSLPTPVPGVTKVPGSGSGKTEAEKAAAQATAAASGQTTGSGQAAKTLLFEKVIEYLSSLAK